MKFIKLFLLCSLIAITSSAFCIDKFVDYIDFKIDILCRELEYYIDHGYELENTYKACYLNGKIDQLYDLRNQYIMFISDDD